MKPKFIKDLGMRYPKPTSKRKYRYWLVKCPSCNKNYETMADNVKSSQSTKCKKCRILLVGTTHGKTDTRLHSTWSNMKTRSTNPNNTYYKNYGARGIKVCPEWLNDFETFYDWAIKNGYSDNLTLDRKDTNGNYEPSNCRFTTRFVQARNTRLLSSRNTSGYRGVSWRKSDKVWLATIRVSYELINLGTFKDKIEAAKTRDRYIIENNLEHTMNFPRSDYGA